jgi:hypothetical protein
MPEPVRHEFRVIIEGVDLPPDVVDRLNRAIQRAAALEFAGLDMRGDFRFHLPAGTNGLWVGPLEGREPPPILDQPDS